MHPRLTQCCNPCWELAGLSGVLQKPLTSYGYKLLRAVVGPHRFVHGCFSYAFECHVDHNRKRNWKRIELFNLLFLRRGFSRNFLANSSTVSSQQIISRGSTSPVPKHFFPETFCTHGRLCVGCNNSYDHRYRFRNVKATSKSYYY